MNKILAFPWPLFPLLVVILLAPRSADAQVAKETPLMTRALTDVPGREGLVETVILAPGEVAAAHRHNADVFAYVLEGSIITQVEGGESRTVHAGGDFYESPRDLHPGESQREYDGTRDASRLLCQEDGGAADY